MTYSKWQHVRGLLNSRAVAPMTTRNCVSAVWRDGFDDSVFAELGGTEWDFDFILPHRPVCASLGGLLPQGVAA